MHLRKDRSLDELANVGNVAQFVSFTPGKHGPEQAYLRIVGHEPNKQFCTAREAISELLEQASDGTINVRSYSPESPRSREFLYGLASVEEAMAAVVRLTDEGLHTIVNETVDVADGGVSGVVQGGIIEFAPDDTPRCVEKPGVASMPLELGLRLLETVYGFRPELSNIGGRVEFSIHPEVRGWRRTHTLLWEHEEDSGRPHSSFTWPNRFSRHLGDKLYGLLMAHLVGMSVPSTFAIPRRIAPFHFGLQTGSSESWIRTCPSEQQPGLFTTHKGWIDPFRLMSIEDPSGLQIASVLAQAGVRARQSGASIVDANNDTVVEGVVGEGDLFMLGRRTPEPLPAQVVLDVSAASNLLRTTFGPVRTEWAHDGETTWILQLHLGATLSTARILVPGERDRWVDFSVSLGLEQFRSFMANITEDVGVRLVGDVGMTSHMADVARKSGVPTQIVTS